MLLFPTEKTFIFLGNKTGVAPMASAIAVFVPRPLTVMLTHQVPDIFDTRNRLSLNAQVGF